ncbi:MAG: DUF1926 domain-containing protein [Spirochaetales bacterium]|nr:DUF1926 domain-containing protein [Spirochaetales bacterium]
MNEKNLIIGLSSMNLADSEQEAEEKYQKVYKPFLRELYNFPEIKAVLHFSGVLLEWFNDKHPEVLMLLEELVKKRKQVEILGGGFYEPLFPMLSAQDRSGQLEALTTLLRKKFGKRPRGCWIPGNYWDNSLILPIKNSGMDYIFLDYDFLDTGIENNDDIYSTFITEDSGKLINVFPVHASLAALDSSDVNSFIEMLKIRGNGDDSIISLIFSDSDIENKSEKWFEDFFSQIQSDRDLKITNPSLYLKKIQKYSKIYIQNSDYYKKTFSDCYYINLLYARMVHVQTLINQIRGDKYKKKSAVESLWAGQNYFSYTTNHFKEDDITGKMQNRAKTYRNLIEAEILTRQKGVFIPSLFKSDFDMDGFDEFLYLGEDYNAFVHLEGGAVFELDSLKEKWNYCDIVNYSENSLSFKKSCCDYFIENDKEYNSIQEFIDCDIAGIAEKEYSINSFEREQKTLSISIRVKNSEKTFSFKLVKKYRFLKKKFDVSYSIINTGSTVINHKFGVNILLSLFYSNGDDRNNKIKKTSNTIQLDDSFSGILIKSDRDADICHEEECKNGIYCYTSVMPVFDIISLEPGKSWENRIEIRV